jgi:hypothetical protein
VALVSRIEKITKQEEGKMEQLVIHEQQQPISDKAIKFRVLAEHRVTRLVRLIAQLGNLSRRTTYDYTPAETEQVFKALREALDAAEAKFRGKQSAAFRFED